MSEYSKINRDALNAINEYMHLRKRKLDVFLVTRDVWNDIVFNFDSHNPQATPGFIAGDTPTMYGVPIEIFHDKEELLRRAFELANDEDKKVHILER
jgi:hypothetical protein